MNTSKQEKMFIQKIIKDTRKVCLQDYRTNKYIKEKYPNKCIFFFKPIVIGLQLLLLTVCHIINFPQEKQNIHSKEDMTLNLSNEKYRISDKLII